MSPFYQYKCPDSTCATVSSVKRAMSERNDPKDCGQCGSEMDRVFNVPRFNMPKLRFERQVDENRKKAEVQDDIDGVRYDWESGRLRDK